MSNHINTIDKKGKVYEIYNTKNPVIKYLSNRFLGEILAYLKKINANQLKGLDVGCGEGHMINYLHENNIIKDLTGIDLDEERLAFARQNFTVIDYQVEDIYDLSFEENTFDYVLATEIFEHLPDPDAAMEALKKVSKPNAFLLISVPYEPYFHWGNLARGKHWDRGGYTPSHLNFWNSSEFKTFLEKHVNILEYKLIGTFPWMLYLATFKNK